MGRTTINVTRCVLSLLPRALHSAIASVHSSHPAGRIGFEDYYTPGSVWVFDISHLPYGCSVWPGVWTSAFEWPNQGEIDIVEGINKMTSDQITLHTIAGCNVATGTNAINQPAITNCNDMQGSECTAVSVFVL